MNRNAIRFAAAAALLAAATPVFAQGRYEAVLVGSGENFSVEHRGISAPAPTGYVATVEGSGENQSVVHTGSAMRNLARPGVVAQTVGSGENQTVAYAPVAAPAASFSMQTAAMGN